MFKAPFDGQVLIDIEGEKFSITLPVALFNMYTGLVKEIEGGVSGAMDRGRADLHDRLREWWALIVEGVIPEVRRILKPTGSAVFILQPNSEKVGKIRGWLWEFMAWVCREWNMVQDVWWWNFTALPCGGAAPRERGLLRPSVKACVWMGESNCFRDQEQVLLSRGKWHETIQNAKRRGLDTAPSGFTKTYKMLSVAEERGGVTPFNLLPVANNNRGGTSAGLLGHGAGTPSVLVNWWVRYITPLGGVIADPFMGSGTTAVAALKLGRHFYGCDINSEYVGIANKRIEKARLEMAQLSFSV